MKKLIFLLLIFLHFNVTSNLLAQCSPCTPGGAIHFGSDIIISSNACYTGASMDNHTLVTIQSGVTLTICGDWTGQNGDGITVNSGGTLIITGKLDLANTFQLISNGSVSIGSVELDNGSTMQVQGSGTLAVTGNVTTGNSSAITVAAGGDLSVGGSLSAGSGATITVSGTLDVEGSLTVTSGTITATGTIEAATISGATTPLSAIRYRSVAIGNWNATSTWESSTNGTTWSAATATPTSDNDTITIRNGHNVSVTASVSADELTVNLGGTLTINSGQTLTIANGADATDCLVNGTLSNVGVVTTTGALTIGATGVYTHAQNGGTVPQAIWASTSTCKITGATTALPSGITNSGSDAQTNMFGNFVWDCPNQTAKLYFASSGSSWTQFTLEGSFTVNNTGNSSLLFGAVNGSTDRTFTVKGDFIIAKTGTATIFSLSEYWNEITLNVYGEIQISGGQFYPSSMPTPSGEIHVINVEKGIVVSGTGVFKSQTSTGNTSGYTSINFTNTQGGGNTSNLSLSTSLTRYGEAWWNINIKNGRTVTLSSDIELGKDKTFTVESGGTLVLPPSYVVKNNTSGTVATGTTFNLNSGGILKIQNVDGIVASGATGGVQTNTRTFNAGGHYHYTSNAAQVTGNALPTTISGSLVINNTQAINASNTGVTLSQATTISGTLTLTAGVVTTTSTNSLTLSSAGSISGGAATSYVNGPFSIARTSLLLTPYPTFHVGKGGRYLPVTINSITSTTDPKITIEAYSTDVAGTISGTDFCYLSTTEYWDMIYSSSTTTNPNSIVVTVQRPEALGDLNILTSTSAVTSGSAYNTAYVSRGGASIATYSLKNSTSLPATTQSGSKLRFAFGSTKPKPGTATATLSSVCSGSNTTISVSGYSVGATIQWQESDDNGASDAWSTAVGGSNGTSATYTTANITSAKYYRAAITGGPSGCSGTSYSTVASVTISSGADTYYVATTGSDSNNGTTSGTPFLTLQKAIDMVSCSSTTIHIAAGTYIQDDITINNKSNITIIGAGISSTIFDGDFGNRFMAITGTSDNISISDMKIMEMDEGTVNGTYSGGGMYISCSGTVDLTSLYFYKCRCTVNGGSGGGGAIYIGSSSTVNIYKSKFTNNENARANGSQDGASICNNGNVLIENCLFHDNLRCQDNQYDGDIAFKTSGSGSIVNSTLVYSSTCSVPIYMYNTSSITILNSIVYGSHGGYDISDQTSGTITSVNCIGYTGNVWGNTKTNCTTTTDFGFTNSAGGNYSITGSSPCLNYGTSSISSPISLTAPSDDFDGTTRSGNPDVGCYEVISASTITLASNTVSASDNCASSTKVPIQSFSLAVTVGTGNLTNLGFTTTGTYAQADISKYQLWYHTSNDITGASQLGSDLSSSGGAGARTFSVFTSPTLTSGFTYYFWITADVTSGATNNNTIAVSAITTSNLTSSSTKAGSTSAGGTQTIYATPTTSVAGSAIEQCNTASFTLAGNSPSTGTGLWSVTSGTATITTPTSATSGVTGITAGNSATLTWTISNGTCSASTSTVTLTNYATPTTSVAGSAIEQCNTASFTLAGNSPSKGTGLWSVTSGTATITTPASATSGVTGVTAGNSATLTWTISNGTCTASTSTVTLTNYATPTTSVAGSAIEQCNTASFTLAGNSPSTGTGLWSVTSGTATITTPASATSGVTGITAGNSATLTWTISNGTCTASTSTVTLTNYATSNAGTAATSQSIVSGNSPADISVSSYTGTIQWEYSDNNSSYATVGGSSTSATLASATMGALTATRYYRAVVTNGVCASATSNVITITVTSANATITLAANTVSGANPCASSTKVPIQSFSVAVTNGTGNLTNVSFTTSVGTYAQSEITNFKIWYGGTTNDLSLVASPLATLSPTGGNGTTETFTAFTSPTLTSGATYYFWITADIASGVTNNNTLAVNAITTLDLTTTSNTAGTTSAGGTQTLKAAPTTADAGANQTSPVICGISEVTLAGNNPTIGSGTWTIQSGSLGSLTSASTYNTTFNGKLGQTYLLRWTISNGSCASSKDSVTISFIAPKNTTPATGDYVWKGNTNTWSTAGNWLYYDGTKYTAAGSTPTSSNRIIISAINNCASAHPTLTADISIGSLVIETGATFNQSSYTTTISGDFTNDGTFNAGTGTTTFTSAATITGVTTFHNLIANAALTFASSHVVNNSLTLGNKITLGANNLTIGSSGSITGYSASNYIVTNSTGKLKRSDIGVGGATGQIIFPVGIDASYTPIILNNTGTLDDFSVRVAVNRLANGTSGGASRMHAVDRTWFVEEGTPSGSNVEMIIQWNAGEELSYNGNAFNRLNCFISHYTNNAWDRQTGSAALGTGPYTISRSGITSFSPFAVEDPQALPITLIDFTAKAEGKKVRLDWETGTEENNDYFTIERSLDGKTFEKVFTKDGAGNSKTNLYYFGYDASPYTGVSYYRLKQTDFDGKFAYSDIVSANVVGEQMDTEIDVNVYPNPVTSQMIHIDLKAKNNATYTIRIINEIGQQIFSDNYDVIAGNNYYEVHLPNVLAGVYVLEIKNNENGFLNNFKIAVK